MDKASVDIRERLLVVDGDAGFRRSLARRLEGSRRRVAAASTGGEAVSLAGSECFDVVVVDAFAADMGGRALLADLRAGGTDAEFIVLSADVTAADLKGALDLGAFAVFTKPCTFERLLAVVDRAAELVRLRRENASLRFMMRSDTPTAGIVGGSEAIEALRAHVERCASTHGPVLIEGERGTETEAVARAIWAEGPRRDRPFFTLHTTGRTAQVLTDELFGHDQGAFDGATSVGRGLLDGAHGATVFVEEVCDLDLAAQTELLRVIEHGELRRIGATSVRHVDVRVLAATEKDLERQTSGGRFSEDLFYRLAPSKITVPPLRDRVDDIPVLVEHCLKRLRRADEPPREMAPEAMKLLKEQHWPGNTRELVGVVERAVMRSNGPVIGVADIRPMLTGPVSVPETMTLEELERRHVDRVLRQVHGNKSEAARVLGVGRRKLYHLMEKLGLNGDAVD